MQIEHLKTADLIPYANNAKIHTAEQIKQIAESLKRYKFLNPVIIDNENNIIAGHGRVLAAEFLNLETIPCIRAEHLTPSEVRQYRLLDNELANRASYNKELLTFEIGDIGDDGFASFFFGEELLEGLRDEPEIFLNEDETTIEFTLTAPEKWYKEAVKKASSAIRKMIKDSEPLDDEMVHYLPYIQLLLKYCRTKKKRFSVCVPLSEPLWQTYSVMPETIIADFQEFLYAKYNR